jgi:ArsR family transcriptional regulator
MEIITPPTNLQHLAERLKVLAEPKRLLILNLLMEGVHCNCELGEFLDMTPSLISHHLRVLREVGLVEVEKDALDARWVYYSVNEDALQELNNAFGAFFQPQRIKPRRPSCGPQGAFMALEAIQIAL